MPTIRLTEWERADGLRLTERQIEILQSRFHAEVTPEIRDSGTDGAQLRWRVRASSVVGVVATGDGDIVVRPKIPVRNVLFLLGVASGRGTRDALEYAALADAPDLATAVAALFASVASKTLSSGVLRGYRPVAEHRQTLRGRVDVAEQIRVRPGRAMPIAVRYEEHDEDILENRLVLAATGLLLRLKPEIDVARRLRRVVHTLDGVGAQWRGGEVVWTHLNQRYRPLVRLAQLILAGQGLDLDGGGRDAVGLTLNMNVVFETFVCHVVGHALVTAHGGQALAQDTRWALDEGGRVRLRPDLVWDGRGGLPTAVLDAKYKTARAGGVPESDLYQMHAYCASLGLRTGHLVYAEAHPEVVRVVRGGPEIYVHRLDLSADPRELLDAGQAIARVIASR